MSNPHEPEPLRPLLKAAQSDLARHLDEACEHEDVDEESTAQLIRLEESLTDAAQAAKQAVSLRRRLRSGHGTADDGDSDPDTVVDRQHAVERRADTQSTPSSSEASAIREFRDARGVAWRVWAVTPGQLHSDRPSTARLGEYSDGWLAFETDDGSQRRRLPHYPEDWAKRSNHALELLLDRADPVRPRRTSEPDDDSHPVR
jgi:hypothetical protein